MALPTPALPASYERVESVHVSEGPTFHRRRRFRHPLRRWRVVYLPGQLSQSEAGDIVTEWDTADGGTRTFSWTPWTGGAATDVRFASDELTLDVKNIEAYGCQFDLIEEPY